MGQVLNRKGKMKDVGFMRVEGNETSEKENKEAKDRTWGALQGVGIGRGESQQRPKKHG